MYRYRTAACIGNEREYDFVLLAAIVIALATISFQTIRAAHANPADSLRTE